MRHWKPGLEGGGARDWGGGVFAFRADSQEGGMEMAPCLRGLENRDVLSIKWHVSYSLSTVL